ncbi:hypothetical protein C3E89_12830 [Clostridium sp. Cult1]|jgi:prepilin-type N-terminal cleavage/methylation domain-containing protein|nr:hypothetical protein [Clostridium sp. Cult1]
MNGGIRDNKMIKETRGMTLVEIIIVISLLSILLLIPSFKGNNILNYREKKDISEFKKDINYAKNRALVESKLYSVDIRPTSNSYLIFKYDTFPEVVKKKEFTSGVKLKSTNIKNNELIFSYSGAPIESGTISLENSKGKKISITITPATGKVNIYFH